jgi:hypothetical protein
MARTDGLPAGFAEGAPSQGGECHRKNQHHFFRLEEKTVGPIRDPALYIYAFARELLAIPSLE